MTFHEAISNLVESEEQLIEEHKSIIQADQLLLEEEQALLEYVDDVEHDIEGKFELGPSVRGKQSICFACLSVC